MVPLSIKHEDTPLMTLSTNDISITALYHHAECHYAECHYAECHYAECHYAEWRYAKCHYAERQYAECQYAECHGALISNLPSGDCSHLVSLS
jgi:hypothetical protein